MRPLVNLIWINSNLHETRKKKEGGEGDHGDDGAHVVNHGYHQAVILHTLQRNNKNNNTSRNSSLTFSNRTRIAVYGSAKTATGGCWPPPTSANHPSRCTGILANISLPPKCAHFYLLPIIATLLTRRGAAKLPAYVKYYYYSTFWGH